jgi:hypothetical protein
VFEFGNYNVRNAVGRAVEDGAKVGVQSGSQADTGDQVGELGSTGIVEMSWFQGLSVGKSLAVAGSRPDPTQA